jgi:hypothetical protein
MILDGGGNALAQTLNKWRRHERAPHHFQRAAVEAVWVIEFKKLEQA